MTFLTWLGLMLTPLVPCIAQTQEPDGDDTVDYFERKIRPILVAHCYECHSQDTEASGELLVDSRQGLLRGGVSGPAVVPGNPRRSLLLAA
ncbi:MAG: hypothetical protein KDA83_19620, partial [Planctomycetales bacterium]|nr:hypothetical protein [Planctomycetales bacterium]